MVGRVIWVVWAALRRVDPCLLGHTPGRRVLERVPTQRIWGTPTVNMGNLPALPRTSRSVGGHEILPSGGHVAARWRSTVLPSGGQQNCPR